MPLVEKGWAAYGGMDLQSSIKTRVIVSTTMIDGRPAKITEKTKAPDKLLVIIEQRPPGVSTAFGFNGTTAWTSLDVFQPSRILSGEEYKARQCQAISANASALFSDNFHEVYRLKPERVIEGKPYYVLNSRVNDCPDADSYIDEQTYLPRMVAYSDGVHTWVSASRDYFAGPLGEPFPRFTTNVPAFGPIMMTTVISLEDNVELSDDIFGVPPYIVRSNTR